MKILIANPGSTSYKFKLLDTDSGENLFQAIAERIGDAKGIFSHDWGNKNGTGEEMHIPDYYSAVNLAIEALKQKISLSDIRAVGFKVVLAKGVTGCVGLDEDVLKAMEEYLPLAPVHNSVYLSAISVFQKLLPGIPLVGLFETSFHKDIPAQAFLYGIPYGYYKKYGIRKYGFHGASHRYISEYARDRYGKANNELKIISCHLGGSSSICAIKNGISVDTSMGMSPQCGLLNMKRVGDLDSFALLYIMEREGLSIDDMRQILISKGGVYGISELSGDLRDIDKAMKEGNIQAGLAFKSFAYAAKRYIGEYMAILNRADIIVLTGGIGQNSSSMRREILSDMENIGIILDRIRNESGLKEGLISTDDSPVRIAVAPTDEEAVVARAVREYLED